MTTMAVVALTVVSGCGDGGGSSQLSEAAKRGRGAYIANCTACHAPDPTRDGTLGPAVAGSSRELLEARVLRAEYPPGYTPKRDTKQMVAMPHLEGEIDALTAYLREVVR